MKILATGQPAREAIKRGIDTIADCVKVTLGPSGRNAVLGRQDITPIITNDGVTIARNIILDDEIEELGAMIVKEASSLTDREAGDGTTTTTVLLQAIVNEAFEKIKDNGSLIKGKVDTIKLKKDIDIACEQVVEALKLRSKPISIKDIYKVALISVEYEWLAKLIADMFKEIGVDGYVSVEEGIKTGYTVSKGIELNAGFQSEYFINTDDGQCVLENPSVFVTNQKLEIPDVTKIIKSLEGKTVTNLILIAPDMSREVLNALVATKINAGFNAVAIKLPTFDKNDLLIDVATLTEATFMDKGTFTKYEDYVDAIKFEVLGTVDKAIITNAKTVLIGGNGDTKKRVADIKKRIAETESVFDKDMLEKRVAFLSGGIANFKISADSDFEKTYLRLKVEDAINAVQYALKDGVVRGGGVTLKEVSEELPENILTKALKAPYEQIQLNSGGIEIGEDVVDPVKVTISAVKSACSLAGMVITTEVAVAHKKKKNGLEDKNED